MCEAVDTAIGPRRGPLMPLAVSVEPLGCGLSQVFATTGRPAGSIACVCAPDGARCRPALFAALEPQNPAVKRPRRCGMTQLRSLRPVPSQPHLLHCTVLHFGMQLPQAAPLSPTASPPSTRPRAPALATSSAPHPNDLVNPLPDHPSKGRSLSPYSIRQASPAPCPPLRTLGAACPSRWPPRPPPRRDPTWA